MIGDLMLRAGPDYGPFSNAPIGALIHSLEAPRTADVRSLTGWANSAGVSPHTMSDLVRIVQLLDERRSGAHAGSKANPMLIAFEVTGYADWSEQQWMADIRNLLNQARAVAALWRVMGWSPDDLKWGSIAELQTAYRRRQQGLPPGPPRLWTHNDVSEGLGGTNHYDPGRNFPWAQFLKWCLQYLVGKDAAGSGPGGSPSLPSGGGVGGADPGPFWGWCS